MNTNGDSWKYSSHKFEYEGKYADSLRPWAGHKDFAYDLVFNIRPRVIVELGTEKGTSLFSFSQAVKDLSLKTDIYAIDTWEGDEHAGYYGEEVYALVKDIKETYYPKQNIMLKRELFDEALRDFANGSIDVLHIDGLHTYGAVKHDFESWLPKLREDGIILFHDIAVKRSGFGVYKLWADLKNKYGTISFMHSNGLGVLLLNKNRYQGIMGLESSIKGFYEKLGEINDLKEKIKLLESGTEQLESLNMTLQKECEIKQETIKELEVKLRSIYASRVWRARNMIVSIIRKKHTES